jgi:hypothetical protein
VAFMYVTTKSDSVIGEGTHSVPILEPNRRSLIKGNLDLANRIIQNEFDNTVLMSDVVRIDVELTANSDPDEDEDLITIFEAE